MGNNGTKSDDFQFHGDGVSSNTNWKKEEILGSGAYGSVYRGTKKTAKGVMVFAVKEIKIPNKNNVQNIQETVKKEITALHMLSHERIIQYYGDCCSNELVHYIFLEYMPVGSLNDFIDKYSPKEEHARILSKQIIEGVDYLHRQGLFHRDIKSANCLMRDHYDVKLADFGLTREYQEFTQSYTKEVGTYRFMAPEMLHSNRYNKYVDIWSLGCVVLHMLTGKKPFHHLNEQQHVIFRLSLDPSPISGLTLDVSISAKEFLEKIFQVDPRKRPDADVLLEHEFVTDIHYFPHWEKEKILSSGDYSSVYLTTKRTSRGVLELVCKEVKFPDINSQRIKEIIKKEIRALSQLSHKRIITYFGVNCFVHNNSHYIFNEFMPAGSLSDFIMTQKYVTLRNARNIARQILEGVEYLHGLGFFHRDIKSSNILMYCGCNVKLANYGLTSEYQEVVRSYKIESLETIRFMAPESLTSVNYNEYTDIWSVGCVVLHMLTGKEPFHDLQEPEEIKSALYYNQSPIAGRSFTFLKSAENFFQKTFQIDPKTRPDATVLLKEDFITGPNLGLTRKDSNESVQTNSSIAQELLIHGPCRLLLIGQSGNGSRCSVRSIERFDSLRERMVAVNCSGVGDCGADLDEPIKSVIENVKCEILRYGGFDAIVFVQRYGVRFTRQGRDSVEQTEKMFGEDVLRRYGMILMTHGDLFEEDNKDKGGGSFIDWCRSQTGDIQKLFQKVNYRIVLFDNKTRDSSKLETQFNMLCAFVLEITAVYDMKTFERARSSRDELVKRENSNLNLKLPQQRHWIHGLFNKNVNS